MAIRFYSSTIALVPIHVLFCAICLSLAIGTISNLSAQPPSGDAVPIQAVEGTGEAVESFSETIGESQPPELTEEQQTLIKLAIEELASEQFATRERAATRLSEMGKLAIPSLREVVRSSQDPEVRLRAGEIVRQMTDGDMKSRIEDFLAGKHVEFEGWRIARALLGDTAAVRELFVGLITEHPTLMKSMEGTPRDRALASEKVLTTIQNKMFVKREFPNRVDSFAILIAPALDTRLPINASYESVLLSVMQKEAANKVMKDAQLSMPFKALLNRWMGRSTMASRVDVLLLGMAWKLDATLPLAIQTLVDAKQTETIAIAMQAVAHFGDRSHAEFLRPLMDDNRPSAEQGFLRGKESRTEIGDVAMVAIALLYGVETEALGLGVIERHPTFGFMLSDVGFPTDDPEQRKKARANVEMLFEKVPQAEES